MSTRTPIKFGAIMENVFKLRLSHYEPVLKETSNQFLFYVYRRMLVGSYKGYLLVQASRSSGRVCFEVAVSRADDYPYHRLRDLPVLAVAGLRERMNRLAKGFDHSEEYQNGEGLNRIFLQLTKDVDASMSRLMAKAVPLLNSAHQLWKPLYNEWVRAERKNPGPPPGRYPLLPDEAHALELLEKTLGTGRFDRYLGPLKYRYRNQDFFHCHLYLLARGLEFLEPPPLQATPEDEVPPKPVIDALDDPIASMTGRLPQDLAVDLPVSSTDRLNEFAFLHSLAAVESLLTLDAHGRPLEVEGQDQGMPSTFVLDSPNYTMMDDPEYVEPADETPAIRMPVSSPTPRPAKKDDEDDPFGELEARLGLR